MTPDFWRHHNTNHLSPEDISIQMSSGQRSVQNNGINKTQKLLQNQFEGFNGLQPIPTPGSPELKTTLNVMAPDSWRQHDTNNLTPENLMLSDDIINQAQELLQNQFEDFDGLQPVAALLIPGYVVLRKAVQIHYDQDRKHWLTTCFRNGKILVADSINTINLSPTICEEINNIYGVMVEDPLKHVQFLNVDQQLNNYDCGVFAVAFAYEFLTEDGDPTAVYDHGMMRNHLICCLQNGRITRFPKKDKM
ncbi:uncharacterized protein LOC142750009 [Rhinoderma darwinii]|uniref:uncharacterized protein LOC142750008 n=1 Tax=Rhinoderma darwinii TaxID=43563 RepID=UPI003F66623C